MSIAFRAPGTRTLASWLATILLVVPGGAVMAKKPTLPGKKASYKVQHFRISRKVLQDWLANPMKHATSARVMPHYVKGKHQGLRLVWVRKNSIYARAGILSGDVALRFNGLAITVSNALNMYSSLPYAKQINLVLLRKGLLRVHIVSIGGHKPVPFNPKELYQSAPLPRPQGRKPAPLSVRQILGPGPALKGRPRKRARPASRPGIMRAPRPGTSRRGNVKLLLKQVRQNKHGVYLVPKALVEYYTARLDELGAQAAIVPYFQRGRTVGFRIYRIKRGSLYSRLGIRSGDVVMRLNGYEFTSPQKALEAYSAFSKATKWSLLILRRGKVRKQLYRAMMPQKAPASRPIPPARRR